MLSGSHRSGAATHGIRANTPLLRDLFAADPSRPRGLIQCLWAHRRGRWTEALSWRRHVYGQLREGNSVQPRSASLAGPDHTEQGVEMVPLRPWWCFS